MNERINEAQHQKIPLNSNRNFSQLSACDQMSNEYWRHQKNDFLFWKPRSYAIW